MTALCCLPPKCQTHRQDKAETDRVLVSTWGGLNSNDAVVGLTDTLTCTHTDRLADRQTDIILGQYLGWTQQQ